MAKQLLKLKCSSSKYTLREDVFSEYMQRITVATTVFCIVLLMSPAVRAEDPFSTGAYPVGWYDAMAYPDDIVDIYYHGGNTVLAYWSSATPYTRRRYLDEAAAGGIRVIVGIDEELINPIPGSPYPVDEDGIIDLVNTYKDHPAVAGWYTADEPWYVQGISLDKMQTAYDAIKSVDTKPVFICFTGYAMYEATPSIPVQWKTAYDQFLIDSYPTRIGEPEFSRLEDEGRGKDFKLTIQRAHEQSILADRPWWAVLSGWGNNTGESGNYRLPTYNESRFATYWSLSENPSGILHFAYYRTGGGSVPARPDEPYPYDGEQWLEDVWEPQAAELNTLSPAVLNGKIAGAVSDDATDIRTDVYYDPATGKYYLVTLNETTGSETPTFTVDMVDPPGEKFISATLLFEGAQPTIPIIGDQFSDEFSQYGVHVYELVTMLLGDADGSSIVSADDYGSVQVNFGDTGDPGLSGDANGDGVISADDYGSVQSNFGATTGMGGAPVPEPATLTLLVLGGVAMLRHRRKFARLDRGCKLRSFIVFSGKSSPREPENNNGKS